MVDHPEVSVVEGKQVSVLELKVAKSDIGEIIGKRGRNSLAIRTILRAASAKRKKRTIPESIENEKPQKPYTGDKIEKLLKDKNINIA